MSDEEVNPENCQEKTNLTYTIDQMDLSSTSLGADKSKNEEEEDWWNNLDEFISDNESLMNDTLTQDQIEVIKKFAALQEKKKTKSTPTKKKFLQSSMIENKTAEIKLSAQKQEENLKKRPTPSKNRRIVKRRKISALSVFSKIISNQNEAAEKISASLMKVAEAQALTALAISDFTKVATKIMQVQKKNFLLEADEHDFKKQKIILQIKNLQKKLISSDKK